MLNQLIRCTKEPKITFVKVIGGYSGHLVSEGVIKEREFGIFGFWPFGGPSGWGRIVGFLIITWNPLMRCLGKLGIYAFGGLRFVKKLVLFGCQVVLGYHCKYL